MYDCEFQWLLGCCTPTLETPQLFIFRLVQTHAYLIHTLRKEVDKGKKGKDQGELIRNLEQIYERVRTEFEVSRDPSGVDGDTGPG